MGLRGSYMKKIQPTLTVKISEMKRNQWFKLHMLVECEVKFKIKRLTFVEMFRLDFIGLEVKKGHFDNLGNFATRIFKDFETVLLL